jgi:hypothetical protein
MGAIMQWCPNWSTDAALNEPFIFMRDCMQHAVLQTEHRTLHPQKHCDRSDADHFRVLVPNSDAVFCRLLFWGEWVVTKTIRFNVLPLRLWVPVPVSVSHDRSMRPKFGRRMKVWKQCIENTFLQGPCHARFAATPRNRVLLPYSHSIYLVGTLLFQWCGYSGPEQCLTVAAVARVNVAVTWTTREYRLPIRNEFSFTI